MNQPSLGRAPARQQLRIYCAGDDDPSWRLDLLQADHHETYSTLTQNGGSDILEGALPYGHHYIGPYTVRTKLEPGELSIDAALGVSRPERLQAGPERARLAAIARADLIFAWMTPRCGPDFGVELGVAYATGKAVILAAPHREGKSFLDGLPLATEVSWKMHEGMSARDAFEWAVADLDVTFERGMTKFTSKYDGRCTVCHSSYKAGDVIYYSRPQGGMHPDCYARVNNPKEKTAAVFNSELVNALRSENAKLETECLALMTKNSMLEKQYNELYSEKCLRANPDRKS